MTAVLSVLCRFGWHRDIVKESRTFQRKRTDEGESIDAYEIRKCACGDVTETEQHTVIKHTRLDAGQVPQTQEGKSS